MPPSASEDAGGAGASLAPKPFLRRGSGWQARMEAAREGRRYMPRGGPIKDYSKDEELPARSKEPRGRATAPASHIPLSPSKAAAPGRSRSYAMRGAASSAAASPARAQRQPAAGRPAGSIAPACHVGAQPAPNKRAPAADPRQLDATTNQWACKLLAAGHAPAAAAGAQVQAQHGSQARRSQRVRAALAAGFLAVRRSSLVGLRHGSNCRACWAVDPPLP